MSAATARLKELAERWSIPVATTLRAKGVFPEDHALSLGVFGYAGTRHATEAILKGELDCLVVLGSGFNERDTMHWTVRERMKAFMIHVNTDMDELTTHGNVGHVVPGSCHAFLDLMHDRADFIAPALQAGQPHRREWLAKMKAGPRLYDAENCKRPTSPIHPATAITALRKAFPRSGAVLVDSGAHRAFAGHYWNAYEPRTYISATNSVRWDGPFPRPSACNARGRTGASPLSPAMDACRCTASKCRPRHAIDCRSSIWSSTTARSAMSGCVRGNMAPSRPS